MMSDRSWFRAIAVDTFVVFISATTMALGLCNLAFLILVFEPPLMRMARLISGLVFTGIGSTVFKDSVEWLYQDLKEVISGG